MHKKKPLRSASEVPPEESPGNVMTGDPRDGPWPNAETDTESDKPPEMWC